MSRDERDEGGRVYDDAAAVIRVPCPGCAHKTGEPCLVCDAENDGTISVIITAIERDALARASQGLRLDGRLESRLLRLHLIHEVAGCTLPTETGYALLGHPRSRAS